MRGRRRERVRVRRGSHRRSELTRKTHETKTQKICHPLRRERETDRSSRPQASPRRRAALPRPSLPPYPSLARAANAAKRSLNDFRHADTRTCKAFGDRMIALIRKEWPGVRIARCDTYLRKPLPDFYFSKGPLLIGDYVEWRKKKHDR